MFDRILLPRWLWLIAVGVWFFSGFVDPKYLVMALIFVAAGLGQPVIGEKLPDGTRRITWELSDWIGLTLLMVVIWALVSGISPIDIITAIRGS